MNDSILAQVDPECPYHGKGCYGSISSSQNDIHDWLAQWIWDCGASGPILGDKEKSKATWDAITAANQREPWPK